jgi:aryl-alcohol dehydrogenase-like predicted oxidoreductase
VLEKVARETGESHARIALAWVVGRPGVTSTLMGVSRASQVLDNAAALNIVFPNKHSSALDAVSQPDPRMLYTLLTPALRQYVVFGGAEVRGWRA